MADDQQMPNDEAAVAAPLDREFVELFTRHQRRLYLLILAQVPRPADAEEILQETNLVIWRKAAKFQPGTNFFAWAAQIAGYEVLKYRERKHRERRTPGSAYRPGGFGGRCRRRLESAG